MDPVPAIAGITWHFDSKLDSRLAAINQSLASKPQKFKFELNFH
jgi:hypothetical protein